MERKVLWSRPTGNYQYTYTSKCGRYTIVKRHFATVGYLFTVVATGKQETVDTLRDAKDEAEYDNDPNWEPS